MEIETVWIEVIVSATNRSDEGIKQARRVAWDLVDDLFEGAELQNEYPDTIDDTAYSFTFCWEKS